MMKRECILCNNKTAILEDMGLSLYRCDFCGHVFKDIPKQCQENYDDKYFIGAHKNWFSNPDFALFELIYRQIIKIKGARKLRILDVGCGRGNFLKYLLGKRSGLELYGVDLMENSFPGINFITQDILTSNIDLKFDVVCSLTAIEHMDSPYSFMEKINSLLNHDGIVFCVTDNDDSMIYNIARLLRRIGAMSAYNRMYMAQHLQCFSRKSLKLLMTKSGLSVVMHRNHNHPIKAVDYPKAGLIIRTIYMFGIYAIFFLSAIFRNGILQIIICKRRVGAL